jgi:hypothetical protein
LLTIVYTTHSGPRSGVTVRNFQEVRRFMSVAVDSDFARGRYVITAVYQDGKPVMTETTTRADFAARPALYITKAEREEHGALVRAARDQKRRQDG